jgi:hypothetical protein
MRPRLRRARRMTGAEKRESAKSGKRGGVGKTEPVGRVIPNAPNRTARCGKRVLTVWILVPPEPHSVGYGKGGDQVVVAGFVRAWMRLVAWHVLHCQLIVDKPSDARGQSGERKRRGSVRRKRVRRPGASHGHSLRHHGETHQIREPVPNQRGLLKVGWPLAGRAQTRLNPFELELQERRVRMQSADDLSESLSEMLKRSLTLLGEEGERCVEVIDRGFAFLGNHGVGRHCSDSPTRERGPAGPRGTGPRATGQFRGASLSNRWTEAR